MIRILCWFLAASSLLMNPRLFGQIDVDVSSYTVEQLVEQILFRIGCNRPENVKFNGNPSQVGYFADANASVGFKKGIIISTGNATQVKGTPITQQASSLGTNSDADLEGMLNNQKTYDAASIEFDVLVQDDTISFRYVFASEEYPEFVCSHFNDIFALFISGPGINGQQNMAVLPGSGSTVAINNVNNGNPVACQALGLTPDPVNVQYYVSNNTQEKNNAAINAPDFAFDGFTTVLTAKAAVQKCEKYHFKIVIADVRDGSHDSGILLEAESFSQVASFNINAHTPLQNDTLPEGCNGTIEISLPNVQSTNTTINYAVSGSASNGTDYNQINGTLEIPAGQLSGIINVEAFTDGVAESAEDIIITIDNPCPCKNDMVTSLVIVDADPLASQSSDTVACDGTPVTISPTVAGGVLPYSYSWATGETTPAISVLPSSSTEYVVDITDACGTVTQEKITANPSGVNFALVSTPSSSICMGDSITIETSVGNAPGSFQYNWSHGLADQPTHIVKPTSNTSYTVHVKGDCGDQKDTIRIWVVDAPSPKVMEAQSGCGPLKVHLYNANPYGDTCTCIWALGDGTTLETCDSVQHTYTKAGKYSVNLTVTNKLGCSEQSLNPDLIEVFDYPVANFSFLPEEPNIYSNLIELTNLSSLNTANFEWIFPDLGSKPDKTEDYLQFLLPQVPASYLICLAAETVEKCPDTICKEIKVSSVPAIYVPNTFTPDGDGTNDIFLPKIADLNSEDYELKVFNRWGDAVYSSNRTLRGWDGNNQQDNTPAPQATYVWKITYVNKKTGEKKRLVGHVNLIR